jgi:hypothetical protein
MARMSDMGPIVISDEREPLLNLLHNGRVQEFMEALGERGIVWFLEMDFEPLIVHLAPLRSSAPGDPCPARVRFLLDATSPTPLPLSSTTGIIGSSREKTSMPR